MSKKISDLEKFESGLLSVIKTVDLNYFNLDQYIIDQGFDAKSVLQAELQAELLKFEKTLLAMVKNIDLKYFDLNKYIIDSGFACVESVIESKVLTFNKPMAVFVEFSKFITNHKPTIGVGKYDNRLNGTSIINRYFIDRICKGSIVKKDDLKFKNFVTKVRNKGSYNGTHFQRWYEFIAHTGISLELYDKFTDADFKSALHEVR